VPASRQAEQPALPAPRPGRPRVVPQVAALSATRAREGDRARAASRSRRARG
jgi:hypothetical protein